MLSWLGCESHQQADESGDWHDHESAGESLRELCYAYWANLSHEVMFAALLLKLPDAIRDDPRVLALLRGDEGYELYQKMFLKPSARVDLKKLPSVTVGKQKYVLATSYDDATRDRANALITGKPKKPATRKPHKKK